MNSCIYQGSVLHRRFHPTPHAFTYRLFMMYLDLDELHTVFANRWLWSTRRPNLAWFRRSEHLGDPQVPLDESVRSFVEQQVGDRPAGPIRLLTHLRYCGFQMNPVSFFFCYDQQEQVVHIVAEVNNTPWGEQHCYLLQPRHYSAAQTGPRERLEKAFHVSPFLPMAMNYQWRVTVPGDNLRVGISNFQEQQRMLTVAMSLHRKPLTASNLRRVLLRYPLMTVQVFAGIYWQALRLKSKKVPFFPHPARHDGTLPPSTAATPEETANDYAA